MVSKASGHTASDKTFGRALDNLETRDDDVRFYLDANGNNPFQSTSQFADGYVVYELVNGTIITLEGILYADLA